MLANNLQRIQTQMAKISEKCRLVAVSKTKPVGDILELYQAGQMHFGENYVQEIVEKAPQLPHEIKWHFIGHLQSNKVKSLVNAVPNLFMVETVDSMKIASKLNTEWKKVSQTPLQVLIQVNTSLEEQKHGIMAEDAPQLVQHIHNECDMLEFKGYMTIGKLGSVGAEYFTNLAALKSKEDEELSMGMSNDFALAMEHGSTSVRIGSKLFGAR